MLDVGRGSLRWRFAIWFGLAFVFGAVGLRVLHYQAASRWLAQDAVAKIIEECGAGGWVRCDIKELTLEQYRQEHKGRPGKSTRYVKRVATRFDFTTVIDELRIAEDAVCDGGRGHGHRTLPPPTQAHETLRHEPREWMGSTSLVDQDGSTQGPYYVRRFVDQPPAWGTAGSIYHLHKLLERSEES